MAESKHYEKMHTAMKEILEEETAEEIKELYDEKKRILDNLKKWSNDIDEDVKEAYLNIIKNIVAGEVWGRFKLDNIYRHNQYYGVLRYLLQEYFPDSEIDCKRIRKVMGGSDFYEVIFSISKHDIKRNKDAIDKYKEQLMVKKVASMGMKNPSSI